jgi:hypothetical protein
LEEQQRRAAYSEDEARRIAEDTQANQGALVVAEAHQEVAVVGPPDDFGEEEDAIMDDEGGHLKRLDDNPNDKPRTKILSSRSAASHHVPLLMPGGETWQDHHPVESIDAPPAEESEICLIRRITTTMRLLPT